MKTTARGLVSMTAGALLMPAACASLYSACKIIYSLVKPQNIYFPLLLGAIGYTSIYVAKKLFSNYSMRTNNKSYVIAHELSHAITGFLSGAVLRKIKIRKQSGFVLMDYSNLLVTLAPYYIPLYAIILSLTYFVINVFFPHLQLRRFFLFAIGFTTVFHIIHTIDILSGPLQDDLKESGGLIFSLCVIILLTSFSFMLVAWLVLPERMNSKIIVHTFISDQKVFYGFVIYMLKYIFNYAHGIMQRNEII